MRMFVYESSGDVGCDESELRCDHLWRLGLALVELLSQRVTLVIDSR